MSHQTRFEVVIIWPEGVQPTTEETAQHLDFMKWMAESYNYGMRITRDGEDIYSDKELVHLITPMPFIAKTAALTPEQLEEIGRQPGIVLAGPDLSKVEPFTMTPAQESAIPVVMTAGQIAELEASPDWVKLRD